MREPLIKLLDKHPRATGLVLTIRDCGGFYRTPREENGRPRGPYVAYADGIHCGDTYISIGSLEENMPIQIKEAAKALLGLRGDRESHYYKIVNDLKIDTVIGVANGGIAFGFALVCELGKHWKVAQKIETPVAGRRPVSSFAFTRYDPPRPGTRCLLVEDVINNRSSREKVKALCAEHGAEIVASVCIWDRSEYDANDQPTFSLVHVPLPQYKVSDVEAEGITVINPKSVAARLQMSSLMARYPLQLS